MCITHPPFGISNYHTYRLEWELDGFQTDLKEARENLEGMIADSDLLSVTTSYGKRIPKKCRLSPDGWFQVRIIFVSHNLYDQSFLSHSNPVP